MTYSGTPNVTGASSPGNQKPASNRRLYLVLAGGAVVALLGGAGLKLMQDNRPASSTAVPETSTNAAGLESAQESPVATFEAPFLQASPSIRLADPALLQSTSSQTRVETIAAGRPDPFAPLVTPSQVPARPTAAVPVPPPPSSIASQPASVPPALPVVPVVATQSLPPLPQGLPVLPSLPTPFVPGSSAQANPEVAVAPTAVPTFQSLVDQVTISGVVQIGSSVSAIVTEPGSPSGRRVSQGETVAGGRIRVKAIDMSGPDPVVVLTYDGQDHYRTVGSGAMVGSL